MWWGCCSLATEALLCAVQGKKRISCPTCRTRVIAADMAYVALRQADGAHHQARADEEAGVEVRGSYGTKVRSWLILAGYRSRVHCTWTEAAGPPMASTDTKATQWLAGQGFR